MVLIRKGFVYLVIVIHVFDAFVDQLGLLIVYRNGNLLEWFLFPVIQPLATYGMCVKQLEELPPDLELAFDAGGVYVTTGGSTQIIHWDHITNAIKQKNMIVVMSDDRHGYMLTDRTLGKEKEEFFTFLCDRIRN